MLSKQDQNFLDPERKKQPIYNYANTSFNQKAYTSFNSNIKKQGSKTKGGGRHSTSFLSTITKQFHDSSLTGPPKKPEEPTTSGKSGKFSGIKGLGGSGDPKVPEKKAVNPAAAKFKLSDIRGRNKTVVSSSKKKL